MQCGAELHLLHYLNPHFGHLKVDRKFPKLSDLREEGLKSAVLGITCTFFGENKSRFYCCIIPMDSAGGEK